jgi:asparagine synthase (glutamine-hydrolysing)
MPGIVGLITKIPRHLAEAKLVRMVDAIHHESFYETGTWIDETVGVYVGWAVRKNSFADCMPLRNELGDVTLVFSGEEYPPSDVRCRLRERGHEVAGDEASYLVHLYEDDPGFPVGLNGVFHGLVIDRTRGTATLFNDRCGMHRICYHESRDAFYFAAEAKAILEVRPDLRSADSKSFGELVACSCVLEDRTIFKGIHVLPGGSAWVFRNGSVENRHTYFRPREWLTTATCATVWCGTSRTISTAASVSAWPSPGAWTPGSSWHVTCLLPARFPATRSEACFATPRTFVLPGA